MFGNGEGGSFRGVGMVLLQVLRAFTIIGLSAINIACWALIIHVNKDTTYFVFEATSLVFTSFLAVFLAVSELPIGKQFYRDHWPAFSDLHGLGWLGLAIIVIACTLLGKLNHPKYGPDEIGLPWWRLVLASGILNITFGVLNIVATFVFGDRKNSVTARDVRAHGSLAESHKDDILPSHYSARSASFRNEKAHSKFFSKFWAKNDDGGKTSTRPQISGPISTQQNFDNDSDHDTARLSPIVPTIARPDSALHPIHARQSSYYSEAHMSRF
jgi:hypothetical protein